MLRERNNFINVMAKAITSDGEFGFGNIKCLNQHLYYCCIFFSLSYVGCLDVKN